MLEIGQVAKMAGCSKPTIARECDRGSLPHWRTPGGHRRFYEADVAKWLQDLGLAPQTSDPAP